MVTHSKERHWTLLDHLCHLELHTLEVRWHHQWHYWIHVSNLHLLVLEPKFKWPSMISHLPFDKHWRQVQPSSSSWKFCCPAPIANYLNRESLTLMRTTQPSIKPCHQDHPPPRGLYFSNPLLFFFHPPIFFWPPSLFFWPLSICGWPLSCLFTSI